MCPKKIIFFDVDHTLYDPISQSIPSDTLHALKTLHNNKDILLAIATGRAFHMLDVIKPIMSYIDIYITINGQIVNHKGNIIYDEPMDKDQVISIKERFEAHNLNYGFIGKTHQAVNALGERAIAMFKESAVPLAVIDRDFNTRHQVYQMWAFADEATLKRISNTFSDLHLVPWLSDGFDIIHTNRSKLDGINTVLNAENLTLDDAYCFGDGMNDLEMIRGLKHSVAMGNAPRAVKECASFVTTNVDEGGIVKGLKHFKLL